MHHSSIHLSIYLSFHLSIHASIYPSIPLFIPLFIPILRHLGSQLHELEKAIENLMEADFIHVALEDLQSRVIFVGEGERIGSPEEVQTEVLQLINKYL